MRACGAITACRCVDGSYCAVARGFCGRRTDIIVDGPAECHSTVDRNRAVPPRCLSWRQNWGCFLKFWRSRPGGVRSPRRKVVAAIADRALPLSEHVRYAWKNWRPFHRTAASVTCRNPGDAAVVDNHLSELRASQQRNHADGCVPVLLRLPSLLRLPRLRCTDETETGRLLRVLLIR